MKPLFIIFLLTTSISFSFAQQIRYEFHSPISSEVSMEKVALAKTFFDLRPGYAIPVHENFTSTQLSVTTNGIVKKAMGKSETLNPDQRRLLQSAEVGSEIAVEMNYIHQNQVTLFTDLHKLSFKILVGREAEAMYTGGNEEILNYLDKNALKQIDGKFWNTNRYVVIKFSISESGDVANVKLEQSSKDDSVDSILIKAIRNMQGWKAAKNAKGVAVKQEYEFSLGNGC